MNYVITLWPFSKSEGGFEFVRTSEKPCIINNKFQMTKILTMPAMATEGTTVCYTVTHDDLIDFAREIIERTKEMDEAEKAETSASVEDGYYTRKEVMTLLKRCDSTMTKWAHAGYLVPVRVGGKHLYRKSDVDKLIGK